MKTNIAITLVLLAVVFCGSAYSQNIKVDKNTTLFYDNQNRTRIFHGLNVVYKIFPYYPPNTTFDPTSSFVESDAADLKKWGFNSIRLFMSWEGFEPVRQQYNYTYLAEVQKIIELCMKYDIFVYLDAHQDLYSRFFCGEGMPDWTVSKLVNATFPLPLPKNFLRRDENGYPLYEDCHKVEFGIYYATFATAQQGQNFFENYHGIADDFANMWGAVAKHFSQQTHLTNFLGYEIINEPSGPSLFDHFKQWVWPGESNNEVMYPFYEKISAAIWANHPDSLVLYEPVTQDYLSGGFKKNLGQPEKEVFSYHVYCPVVNPEGDPYSRPICSAFDSLFIDAKEKNVQTIKVGGFLTEFGALSNSTASAKELDFILNKADTYLRSWSYWQYKGYNDVTTAAQFGSEGFYNTDGSFQSNKAKHLSRPYASAICGKDIVKSQFHPNLMMYELEYTSSDCGGAPTEVYVSPDFWFNFFSVVVHTNVLSFQPKPDSPGYYYLIPKEINQKVHLILTQ